MTIATLDRSTGRTPATSVGTRAAPVSAGTSTNGTAGLVGLCFLVATFTFAIGNALIRPSLSSATAHRGSMAGALLLGFGGVAVAVNGVAMRRKLLPSTPLRSRAYSALRGAECLTLLAVAVSLITGHRQWNGYVLAVYAVSGAAGLVLSSALLTSKIVPRNLSLLGLVGYPIFLAGTALAVWHVIGVTHGVGMLALVPGGLFELILPIWLFTKGFGSHEIAT
ncbi:MAG TPA: DUF4386 family protein [Acidimicrobiales bacterium]|nr:DUF4386 family protein [Acidimicrobiales bacterium]